MALFRDQTERFARLNYHPRRRFVQLIVFALVASLFGVLRYIFLFKNFPGDGSTYVIIGAVCAAYLIPIVNLIFDTKWGRDSQVRKVALAVFIASALLGLPMIEGWTKLFPTYTSHHWLEIPLDIAFTTFGTKLIVMAVRRKLWLAENQRPRQDSGR